MSSGLPARPREIVEDLPRRERVLVAAARGSSASADLGPSRRSASSPGSQRRTRGTPSHSPRSSPPRPCRRDERSLRRSRASPCVSPYWHPLAQVSPALGADRRAAARARRGRAPRCRPRNRISVRPSPISIAIVSPVPGIARARVCTNNPLRETSFTMPLERTPWIQISQVMRRA